jgi:hypothetical protein
MKQHFNWQSRLLISLGALTAFTWIAGCKHETPAQQSEQLQAEENSDVTNYEDKIRSVVKDPARADKLVSILTNLQALVHDTAFAAKDNRHRIEALNSTYAATRGDYDALFARQDAINQAFFKNALDLRQQMAANMTDEEWEQLKPERVKAFEAVMSQWQTE